ncbi:hypothetical protein LCGC14_2396820 [marine sediment metagenome]|uniref:Uncharacterized protein n=1 Tax=marine sediment metagenome TaxID=412755 RepID=A0A0F9BWL2_9ZZZZ
MKRSYPIVEVHWVDSTQWFGWQSKSILTDIDPRNNEKWAVHDDVSLPDLCPNGDDSRWPVGGHGPAQEGHACPYRSDLYDDKVTLCRCCEGCAQECAQDL